MDKNILLVEDNEKTRELLKSFLSEAGFRFDVATDGLGGLNKALKQNYDVIVTDHKMPLMDGFALTRNLRDNEVYRETPIILLTTDDYQSVELKAEKLGVTVVIPKPVSLEDLKNVLDEFAERDIA